mmetsp:Transcript_3211/g.9875  ORF Transcript_3211/g.9875 Transcript_3211/m.9875 type:complete len:245 (+) Transcript_3211:200-934(+)
MSTRPSRRGGKRCGLAGPGASTSRGAAWWCPGPSRAACTRGCWTAASPRAAPPLAAPRACGADRAASPPCGSPSCAWRRTSRRAAPRSGPSAAAAEAPAAAAAAAAAGWRLAGWQTAAATGPVAEAQPARPLPAAPCTRPRPRSVAAACWRRHPQAPKSGPSAACSREVRRWLRRPWPRRRRGGQRRRRAAAGWARRPRAGPWPPWPPRRCRRWPLEEGSLRRRLQPPPSGTPPSGPSTLEQEA